MLFVSATYSSGIWLQAVTIPLGPMIYNEGGFYSLVGIISWGINCSHPDYPGVYTRWAYAKNYVLQVYDGHFLWQDAWTIDAYPIADVLSV